MKQIFNPFLPSFEYIPDGEAHVFGDRVYLYGSHDRFNGASYCLNDYICYSAYIQDLTNWKYEGVIYKKEQDPRNKDISKDAKPIEIEQIETSNVEDLNPIGIHAMYAPDVVEGLDKKYYMYYCLDCLHQIAVAVCDTPAGKYQFLGFVQYKNGVLLGDRDGDPMQFDPAVFIDEDEIYLYSGNAPMFRNDPNPNKMSQVMTLEKDMVTLRKEPKQLLPTIFQSMSTAYEGHEFFEASSIRKINNRYYFVYSSINTHELCYAISYRPDKDFTYGGTLIDLGDVYLNGRTVKEAINPLGNIHGGIEKINDKYYIFYHRQTNRTNYSRQASVEEIFINKDGSIDQVEVTSIGFNGQALLGKGTYPAYICCHLTGENGAQFSHPLCMKMDYPYLTQDIRDMDFTEDLKEKDLHEPFQYIKNIGNENTIGFKYFYFQNLQSITMEIKGKAKGCFILSTKANGDIIGKIVVDIDTSNWETHSCHTTLVDGRNSLYFTFIGNGAINFRRFILG